MSNRAWEHARKKELERAALEEAAARRFNALDTQRMLRDIREREFPDDWLTEAEEKSEATR